MCRGVDLPLCYREGCALKIYRLIIENIFGERNVVFSDFNAGKIRVGFTSVKIGVLLAVRAQLSKCIFRGVEGKTERQARTHPITIIQTWEARAHFNGNGSRKNLRFRKRLRINMKDFPERIALETIDNEGEAEDFASAMLRGSITGSEGGRPLLEGAPASRGAPSGCPRGAISRGPSVPSPPCTTSRCRTAFPCIRSRRSG